MKSFLRRLLSVSLPAAALGLAGCFGGGAAAPATVSGSTASESIKEDTRMTLVDLDQYCMGFGERYLTLVGNACNQVEKAVKEREVKARAHSFKLHAASSVYDIASGANPFAKLMDLILLAELQDLVWNREGLANQVFGAEAALPLVEALKEGRRDAWTLADRILKPDQRGALESMIAEWRAAHPSAESIAFVRFDDFTEYRGKSVLDGVPLGSGLLAPLSDASRQMAESRLFLERAMYLFKRMPLLVRWHAESFLNTMMSRPEVDGLRETADRITAVAESMPAKIADERVAVLNSAKDRVSHAGDEARSVANRIALLLAGLIVLTFALALAYRRLTPRAPVLAPAPRPAGPAKVESRDKIDAVDSERARRV